MREKGSFIDQKRSSLPIRILTKIDIFSFIPVPKDYPVSTKHSLIGSTIFFILFLSFIIYDFYQFVSDNPQISQNSFSKLDHSFYTLPRFAVTFMEGQRLNTTDEYKNYFKFQLSEELKGKGIKDKTQKTLQLLNFQNEDSNNTNLLNWMDKQTQQFYYIMRTPLEPIKAKGLLYATSNATYTRIGINMCDVNSNDSGCANWSDIIQKTSGGRIFLFIEDIPDSNSASQEDNKFLIYNFFLIPNVYKRVTINFQVTKTTILPDYLYRWTEQQTQRIVIYSVSQQTSDTKIFANKEDKNSTDMLSINLQLSPQILNTRISCSTLLDHISMWGAFWGVLFGIFAIIFLTYNRNKFYKKNPQWDKFRKTKSESESQRQDVLLRS